MARSRKAAEPAPAPSTPAAIKLAWFPVALTLPGESQPHRTVKAYVTDDDRIFAYFKARPLRTDTAPDWEGKLSPGTEKPPVGYAARNGVYLTLDDGAQVIITPQGGCGCSNPLKRWSPLFADRVVPW